MPKMIDFSAIAIFGPFRKRQFLATLNAPHSAIRAGLCCLHGHGNLLFFKFKAYRSWAKRASIVMKAFECDMWIVVDCCDLAHEHETFSVPYEPSFMTCHT